MGEYPVRRVLLHGELPRCAYAVGRAGHHPAPRHGSRRHLHDAPATRPWQTLFRVHRFLGLPDVGAVTRDLVRQPASGDVLHFLSADRRMAPRWDCRLPDGLPNSVHRPARRQAEDVFADDGGLRTRESCRDLARALSRDRALDQRWAGAGNRRHRGWGYAVFCWSLLSLLGLVRGPPSDPLATSRRRRLGTRTALAVRRGTTPSDSFDGTRCMSSVFALPTRRWYVDVSFAGDYGDSACCGLRRQHGDQSPASAAPAGGRAFDDDHRGQ